MGLDMYLERMPRYKDATAKDVSKLENYFRWKGNPKAKKYTLKEWCGLAYKDVPSGNVREFYKQFYAVKYYDWDTEKQFGYGRIMEEVGYWRKANQIHNWFVDNVQDGEDDCNYHREVTKEDLEELLNVCNRVFASCELIDGRVENGYSLDAKGNRIPNIEDGKRIKDPSVAEELLPTTSGFFFGGTDYDEWYMEDIKETIDIITKVLETTDFEKEMIYYVSSW